MVTVKQCIYPCSSSLHSCPPLLLDFGLFLVRSLSQSCYFYPGTQSLLPSLSEYLAPGLDQWGNVCFCLDSSMDSYGLGSGCTLSTLSGQFESLSARSIEK